ncbi:MAG: hypothetical protein HY362_02850 [Candidatus Aenigmarchaeota archaeon]|nr:hypothetical protein [Candidatus Aenigmarchaeota archaeon]
MGDNRAKILTVTVFLLMAISLSLFSFGGKLTGFATTDTQSTTANVSINKFVALGITTNLSAGIAFGAVNPGTSNNNASGNYNQTNYAGGNLSMYNISISSTTNVGVDICIYDNANLTNISGGDTATIPNINFLFNASNYTVNAPSVTAPRDPFLGTGIAIDTAKKYIDGIGNDSVAGTVISFRFWLTIPSGQRAGIYNNTVNFLGTENETAC